MNTTPTLPGLESLVKPFKFPATPHEFKVTALRECPTPESLQQRASLAELDALFATLQHRAFRGEL